MRIVDVKTTLFDVCIADTFNNTKLLIKARILLQPRKRIKQKHSLFRSFTSTNTRTDTQSAAKRKRKCGTLEV